jgi:hypothetical protein
MPHSQVKDQYTWTMRHEMAMVVQNTRSKEVEIQRANGFNITEFYMNFNLIQSMSLN